MLRFEEDWTSSWEVGETDEAWQEEKEWEKERARLEAEAEADRAAEEAEADEERERDRLLRGIDDESSTGSADADSCTTP